MSSDERKDGNSILIQLTTMLGIEGSFSSKYGLMVGKFARDQKDCKVNRGLPLSS
jgi:hypothetical protein